MKLRITKDNNYYNNVGAIVGTVSVGLATILANYAKRLGADDMQLTLLTALPALVAFFALIPGAFIIDKAKHKIKVALLMAIVSRSFLLLYALVPLLPGGYQVWALVVLVGLRNAPESIWAVSYQSIIGDVFDYGDLAQVMSIRNRIANMAQLVSVIALSQIMSRLNAVDYNMITALQIVFLTSGVFGLWETTYYRRFEVRRKSKQLKDGFAESLGSVIKTLPKQRRFLRYCLSVLPFYMTWMFPAALFNIYAFRVYQADEKWMTYLTIGSTVFSVLSLPLWKRLIEKKGNGACLFYAMIGSAMVPLAFVLPNSIFYVALLQCIPGAANAGLNLIFFNFLIEMTPVRLKTIYMALFTTLVNLITFTMPLLCAMLIDSLGLINLMFLASGIRLLAGIWVLGHRNRFYEQVNYD